MVQVDYNTRRIDGIHLPIPTGLTPEKLIKQIHFSRYTCILKGTTCMTGLMAARPLTSGLVIPRDKVTHRFDSVHWNQGDAYITADVIFRERHIHLLMLFLKGEVDFVPVSFRATDELDTAVTFLGWDLSTNPIGRINAELIKEYPVCNMPDDTELKTIENQINPL